MVCGFLDLRAELFCLVIILRLGQSHNRCESFVKQHLVTEQFDDSCARASRCFGHLFPKIGLSLIGLTFVRALKTREQFTGSCHHDGVVSWILFLQFQNPVRQPTGERGFFHRDAGGHRAPGRSRSESIG